MNGNSQKQLNKRFKGKHKHKSLRNKITLYFNIQGLLALKN